MTVSQGGSSPIAPSRHRVIAGFGTRPRRNTRIGVRTLTVTEEAYARLAHEKRPGESFTDVILRLTARRSLEDLAAALPPREVNGLAEAWFQMTREPGGGRP